MSTTGVVQGGGMGGVVLGEDWERMVSGSVGDHFAETSRLSNPFGWSLRDFVENDGPMIADKFEQSSNADTATEIRFFGSHTDSSAVQHLKVCLPISLIPDGIFIETKELHPEKAPSPIMVRLGGRINPPSKSQSENTSSPIIVSAGGRVSDVNELHS